MFLRNRNTKWKEYLPKIIANYNNTPHHSLNNVSPNQSDNVNNIDEVRDINKVKESKPKRTPTLRVGDHVRIRLNGIFMKGTEPRYTDDIYTVRGVNNKAITLNNGVVKKITSLLRIPKDTVQPVKIINNEPKAVKNVISQANKINKVNKYINREGLDRTNILEKQTRHQDQRRA